MALADAAMALADAAMALADAASIVFATALANSFSSSRRPSEWYQRAQFAVTAAVTATMTGGARPMPNETVRAETYVAIVG